MFKLGPLPFYARKLSLGGMLVRTALEAAVDTRFGLELALRDGVVPMTGRVAYAQRDDAGKGEVATLLGIEFLDLSDDARVAIAAFIATELGRTNGDGPRPEP